MVGKPLITSFMSGLPPHIAQVICGHKTIGTTIGYKKPRVLHQPGEKPQVSCSAQAPDGFRSPMADAC